MTLQVQKQLQIKPDAQIACSVYYATLFYLLAIS